MSPSKCPRYRRSRSPPARTGSDVGWEGAVGTTPMRATPANANLPDPNQAELPQDLGPHAITVLDGRTFMYSDAAGDVPEGSIGGLVHQDTRLLNRWVLMVNGEQLIPLRSEATDYFSAAFFLTNREQPEK